MDAQLRAAGYSKPVSSPGTSARRGHERGLEAGRVLDAGESTRAVQVQRAPVDEAQSPTIPSPGSSAEAWLAAQVERRQGGTHPALIAGGLRAAVARRAHAASGAGVTTGRAGARRGAPRPGRGEAPVALEPRAGLARAAPMVPGRNPSRWLRAERSTRPCTAPTSAAWPRAPARCYAPGAADACAGRTAGDADGPVAGMTPIREPHASALDHAEAGHSEGDLIMGAGYVSAIVTRSSAPPGSRCCAACPAAYSLSSATSCDERRRSSAVSPGCSRKQALTTPTSPATAIPAPR